MTRTVMSWDAIERRIADISETQDHLRSEIDSMPNGSERERKIDLLFKLHDEVTELRETQLRI